MADFIIWIMPNSAATPVVHVGEVLDHLITAYDEGFIDADTLSKGRDLVNTAVKLINGYMSYLKRAAKDSSDNK